MAGRLVVTLPPARTGQEAVSFAQQARARGAQLLEVRTDLHPPTAVDVRALAAALPLLVSERGQPLPPEWVEVATRVDRELRVEGGLIVLPAGPEAPAKRLISLHASSPLLTEAALALWTNAGLSPEVYVKHVEPLGAPADGARLLKTQAALREALGKDRVTVLATGALALPFRCLLARRNALDYVALEPGFSAAPGQRLLADAVRERKGRPSDSRAAILGASIAHSRSPRIHPPPFDRIDLPPDAPVGELVDALVPYYRGFAVTSPFKKVLATYLGSPLPAVNTLIRRGHGYDAENTDVDGALRVLTRLGGGEVTVLGDGGATAALRLAAERLNRPLKVLKRAEVTAAPLSGPCVWTWPPSVELPPALAFANAQVAVIAYGPPGRAVAAEVRKRGGAPVLLGAAWLIAQARGQRRLWEGGT